MSLNVNAHTLRGRKDNIGPIKENNSYIYKSEDLVEIFANNYEKQFQINIFTNASDINIFSRMQDFIQSNYSARNNLTSTKEIQEIIRKSQAHKVPGYDEITNKALKNLPKISMFHLTNIINASSRLCVFPDKRKHAIISATDIAFHLQSLYFLTQHSQVKPM